MSGVPHGAAAGHEGLHVSRVPYGASVHDKANSLHDLPHGPDDLRKADSVHRLQAGHVHQNDSNSSLRRKVRPVHGYSLRPAVRLQAGAGDGLLPGAHLRRPVPDLHDTRQLVAQ